MKKLFASFVVLSLCCFCVLAFPLSPAKSSENGTAEEQVLLLLDSNSQSTDTGKIINPVSSLLSDYATKSRITKSDVNEVIEKLEAVNEDVEAIIKQATKIRWSFGLGAAVGYDAGFTIGPAVMAQAGFNNWFVQMNGSYQIARFDEIGAAVGQAIGDESLQPIGNLFGLELKRFQASLIFGWTF